MAKKFKFYSADHLLKDFPDAQYYVIYGERSNGKTYDANITDGISEAPKASSGEGEEIKAGLPGNVLRIEVSAGDAVNEGDVLLVMEAMKMETEIKAPKAGTVSDVLVAQGDKVITGQALVVIG